MKHTITITVDADTSKVQELEALLERIEAAAGRLEQLAVDPPPNVEIVRVPDLGRVEVELFTRPTSFHRA